MIIKLTFSVFWNLVWFLEILDGFFFCPITYFTGSRYYYIPTIFFFCWSYVHGIPSCEKIIFVQPPLFLWTWLFCSEWHIGKHGDWCVCFFLYCSTMFLIKKTISNFRWSSISTYYQIAWAQYYYTFNCFVTYLQYLLTFLYWSEL